MIQSFHLKSFGPIKDLNCTNAGKINLIIGPNGSGKTVLLKSLYAAIKTTEKYKRGKEQRKDGDILFDELYWTFQLDQLGKLVRSGDKALEFSLKKNKDEAFEYSFGQSTERLVKVKTNTCKPTSVDSVFIPAKEVLSLINIILKSREDDRVFGFDETYYELARALRKLPTKGRNYPEFAQSRDILKKNLGGCLEYDVSEKEWFFKSGNRSYSVSATSEGIKKMSILDNLLGNHYLKKGAVVFIDEPESALHPSLLSTFMEIIEILTRAGLQFFISTHSYFVIKKLYILAHQHKMSMPVISFSSDGTAIVSDLQKEMPDNPIIEESIRLYEEEILL